MRLGLLEGMSEMGTQECLLVLRIRNAVLPTKSGKLFSTSAAYCLNQSRVSVAGEVLEGRPLAVLFAHEQEWEKRGQQVDACRQLERFKINQGGQTLASRSIPDLVVILRANHKF